MKIVIVSNLSKILKLIFRQPMNVLNNADIYYCKLNSTKIELYCTTFKSKAE